MRQLRNIMALALVGLAGSGLGGCSLFLPQTTGSISPNAKIVQTPTTADRDCLQRAMYFESRRTDEEGLLAVGTVVMNRFDSPKYPDTICGVVGQPRQFASGVLTRPVRDQDRERLDRVADALLAGQRHEKVGSAMHFHTAGLRFPYDNMHYVALAGGNTFYEKTDRYGYLPARIPHAVVRTALGQLQPTRIAAAPPAVVETDKGVPRWPGETTVAQAPVMAPFFLRTRYTSASAD